MTQLPPPSQPSHPPTRKTRIVCISDTHNNTPKLPAGDILIHAGDLTNQGSESEMRRAVEWLEGTTFEAKIVVAGNHDITLDTDFYDKHHTSFRWPKPQDPALCRKLLTDSASITYLENEAASIYLSNSEGPQTCVKVWGSPCQPQPPNTSTPTWAFQYTQGEGKKVWDGIPSDTDIVVTHTPPYGHCDSTAIAQDDDERRGCQDLLQALYRVRPMLAVCGHIHGGRGVERVLWKDNGAENGSLELEASVDIWTDPGIGKKQSIIDLSTRGRRPLNNTSALTRQYNVPSLAQSQSKASTPQHDSEDQPSPPPQPGLLKPTFNPNASLQGVNNEATWKAMSGGALSYRHLNRPRQARLQSDIGLSSSEPNVEAGERVARGIAPRHGLRHETCIVNAAFMGPRIRTGGQGPKMFNKPIVVDVDLPVWQFE